MMATARASIDMVSSIYNEASIQTKKHLVKKRVVKPLSSFTAYPENIISKAIIHPTQSR